MDLSVVLCDDETIWSGYAKELIKNYADRNEIIMSIRTYESGDDLLNNQKIAPDIAFLDIELSAKEEDEVQNGIELARRLNEKWPYCQIVFLSNYLNYATDIFQTRHTYFVLKEQFKDRIDEVFEKIHTQMNYTKAKINFQLAHGGNVILHLSDICYFERHLRSTYIHALSDRYEIRDKLDDILPLVPRIEFARCHNSLIVNLSHVQVYRKEEFLMEDGTNLNISRSYQKAVREQFTAWLKARNL